ncbi:hypothetical protein C8J57DRAFT_1246562 [Mycena rebaudengoi]|nr:hypothetical protein C8J57DRAFT_1246562 [Mycena rebaudengoi]
MGYAPTSSNFRSGQVDNAPSNSGAADVLAQHDYSPTQAVIPVVVVAVVSGGGGGGGGNEGRQPVAPPEVDKVQRADAFLSGPGDTAPSPHPSIAVLAVHRQTRAFSRNCITCTTVICNVNYVQRKRERRRKKDLATKKRVSSPKKELINPKANEIHARAKREGRLAPKKD